MPGSQSMMTFLRVGCLLSLAPATLSMLTLPTPLPTPPSLTAAISSATLTQAETTGNQKLKASRNRKTQEEFGGKAKLCSYCCALAVVCRIAVLRRMLNLGGS